MFGNNGMTKEEKAEAKAEAKAARQEAKAAKQEAKAAKEEEKLQAQLAKFGMQDLTDPEDIESVRRVVSELAGTGLMEAGITLGGGSDRDIQKNQLYYQRAILEQNFIIIRQLNALNKKLDRQ